MERDNHREESEIETKELMVYKQIPNTKIIRALNFTQNSCLEMS